MPVPPPVPSPTPILACGGDADFLQAVAAAAVGVEVVPVDEAGLFASRPGDGRPLVVLCDPEPEFASRVRSAMDEAGLPRWPVVVCSSASGNAPAQHETVARPLWEPAALAHVFFSAIAGHRLARENARLRGELLTFGSRFAHDLRTPLGAVMTTTEMLREVLADDAPKDVALTQPILDSAENQARLIERMSRFARASSSDPSMEPVDMGPVFWNAFQHLEGRMHKAGVELAHPASWPRVFGHPAWIEIIWHELLVNALNHGGAGVRIEAGFTAEPGAHRFWVWDSGSVPEAKRGTLFFPFHRLHDPGAPAGFGLPIVRQLVERQGGRCGFDLPSGGGSRFSFTLPATTAESSSAASPRRP